MASAPVRAAAGRWNTATARTVISAAVELSRNRVIGASCVMGTRRTVTRAARRRQISTVFYLRKRSGNVMRSMPDPPDAAVRAELERILASDVFSRAQQLRRFLSFIVEHRLAGEKDALKESVLAHELYRKGTDFDGGTDPVVRVDARRLRDKLREYYETRSDPVVISLPKGSYVPVFERTPAVEIEPPRPITLTHAQESPPIARGSRAGIWITALAIIATVVAGLVAWNARRGPSNGPAQLLPLASLPGIEGPPALSPDGELVAFAWAGDVESGPEDIYIKAVGSE